MRAEMHSKAMQLAILICSRNDKRDWKTELTQTFTVISNTFAEYCL